MLKSVKLLCSLLLVICICLPLSQCSGSVTEGDVGPAPVVSLYVYGEALEISDSADLFSIGAWILPATLVLLTLRRQRSLSLAIIDLIASLGACAIWLRLVMMSEQLVWGGYLAGVVISLLLVMALIECVCLSKRSRY